MSLATGLLFVIAGVLHFIFTSAYASIVPPVLPAPRMLVWISGLAEIAGGVGLMIPSLRAAAGWGLVALLIAVFPANVYMAMREPVAGGLQIPSWALWARLPLQAVLIWWVLRVSVVSV